MSLRRASDVERTANSEMFSFVIDHVNPLRVQELTGGLVFGERVIRPAVPKAAHDFGEFGRAFVALVAWYMRRAIEIKAVFRVRGGDQVPAGATITDVIQRRELAGHQKWLLIRRGG